MTEARYDPRQIFEGVDIRDRLELERVFREHRPDAVRHLATESHVDRSIHGHAVFIETNVVGTYTLLEVFGKDSPGCRQAHSATDALPPYSPYLN